MVTGKNPSAPPYEIRPIREWNAELSQGLEKIIKKCTESNPENRYENCLELLYDLENYERLDKKFYRKLWGHIGCCFLSIVMTIAFLGLAAYGKYCQRQVMLKEYENVMNEAELAIMASDYTEALNSLQIAITQIDSTREEAYKEMLNIYSMQNQLEEGLASICKYIDTYEGAKRPPDEIIFEVAKQYFNEQEYKKCFQYASMVEGIEEAKYYEALAQILSSLYVNEIEYATQLDAFEKYNASLTNSKNKMDNYKALAMVYVTQVNNSDSAADKSIKICETALIMLEDSEGWLDDEEMVSFEKVFLEYIIKAYEWKKKQAINEPEKKICCSMLEEYYQDIIYMLDDDIEEERKTKLLKMLALANIYQEQQKFQEGRKLCEQMEQIYTGEQDDKISIYLEHIQILCEEQAQKSDNVKKWNMTAILELKEKAEETLPDIKLDREWKKIMVSMELEK